MTTQASPDGQTPPQTTTSTPPTTPDGEPIRDWGEVKRVLAETTESRKEIAGLKSLVEALGEKLSAIAPKAPEPPAGAPQNPPASGLEAQVQALAAAVGGIVSEKQTAAKAESRRAITAAVAAAATETNRELIRGALATMALDGEVDLHAPDSAAETDKALAKLRARYPGAFATATSGQPAPASQNQLIPPGVELHQLTAEQMARLTPEDFAKARRQQSAKKLAV
jgi:hypothetical protein